MSGYSPAGFSGRQQDSIQFWLASHSWEGLPLWDCLFLSFCLCTCLSLRRTYLTGYGLVSDLSFSLRPSRSQVDISNWLDWSLTCLYLCACLTLRLTYLTGWIGLWIRRHFSTSTVCLRLLMHLTTTQTQDTSVTVLHVYLYVITQRYMDTCIRRNGICVS